MAARVLVDDEEQLPLVLESIRHCGFPIDTWTPAAVKRVFLPVKSLLDSVRFVTDLGDQAVISNACAQGVIWRFWVKNSECQPHDFYRFYLWLRTNKGTAVLRSAQIDPAVAKKADPDQEITNTGFVRGLQQQLGEFEKEKKCRTAYLEERLSELHRQIVQAQNELEGVLSEVALVHKLQQQIAEAKEGAGAIVGAACRIVPESNEVVEKNGNADLI